MVHGTTYSDFFFDIFKCLYIVLQKLCEEDQKNAGAAASPEALLAYMLACRQSNEAESMNNSLGTFFFLVETGGVPPTGARHFSCAWQPDLMRMRSQIGPSLP